MKVGFDRTTVIFVIFLLILAGIFGLQRFVQSQPPIEIQVAVDPLGEKWLQAAASAYNDSRTIASGTAPVHVTVIVKDDLDVWRGNPGWNSNDHPQGWIPSSSVSADLIPSTLSFTAIQPSIARTPLVWGSFNTRVAVITAADTRPFDWPAVQEIAAAQRWENLGETGGNINMAINWPSSSMAGIGVLLTAAADYGASPDLARAQFDDPGFTDWFQPIHDSILNSQRIGGSPAEAMASRGATVADYALLPEVQWLQSLAELSDDGVTFAYPAYQFVLDFPLLRWNISTLTDAETAALQSFGNFLVGEQGQAIAIAHGMRPVSGEPPIGAEPFARAESAGIELAPLYGQPITAPGRDVVEAIIEMVK